jgi:LacI family transcriptional regulator
MCTMVTRGQPKRAPKRATMVDVARAAGVGLTTVSRVVNGNTSVAAELVDRVNAAIAALDFQPDESGRQLRRGVAGVIGAAVRATSQPNPVLRCVEESARAAGLMILAASTNDDTDLEREVVMSMWRRRFDGVILEPIGADHGYLAPQLAGGLSLVAIDRPIEGVDADAVLSDNVVGIEMAFRHLVQAGHRRIAYIGDDERIYTGRQRAAAFRACATAAGRPLTGLVHTVSSGNEAAVAAAVTKAFGGRYPATALITGNADTSVLALKWLGADARRIAIVGFDDSDTARLLMPELTVIAQDPATIASTAVALLTSRMAEPFRKARRVTVPVSMIIRGSGELRIGR